VAIAQATIRQPTTTNIYKALGMQFTLGTFPFLLLTFVGYWAYGNGASVYLLSSLGGPKSLVTIANAAAFLQAIVSLHVSFTILETSLVPIELHCFLCIDFVIAPARLHTYIHPGTNLCHCLAEFFNWSKIS
jgi:hypothetical protein